ncbi:hypothetical protein CXF85_15865 [Colwellia sp. 75C3]|uniref:hypothetical protein n=1 Tax=Colwellia sp. 75C3 TaxID=888425 RepID=UPI000C33CE45|nr:hypothetical protein [Colwellia sp. 75C3]PKG82007.1 hypothetical protein CXF85_15865 [Colwellia sp. 75C3]
MNTINHIAESYVKLSLNIGQHCEYYVDAYYGPEQWRPSTQKITLAQLKENALTIISAAELLNDVQINGQQARLDYLTVHLRASLAYIDKLAGVKLDFRSECKALYDVVPTEYDEAHFDRVLIELDALVPGKGELNQRFNEYRSEFIIPKDKLSEVFDAAINEARRRTLQNIDLPTNENFDVELVHDQVWTAYNWYKGESYSLIQLNTDIPIYIERAVDLAAHEGYPGHHLFNSLLDKELYNDRGWVEYSIYNLYGPTSLLAEGSANYGIEVAFPWQQRIIFERDTLFPLAGIDQSKAEVYYQTQTVLHKLSYADNMVAQRYIDNEITAEQAIGLLMKYSLFNEERARQRLSFIERNRSYVITYNYGQDLVRDYLATQVTNDSHKELWLEYLVLLALPKTGSMMEKPT